MGVDLYDGLRDHGLIAKRERELILTRKGEAAAASFGIDVAAIKTGRRPACRACLDWSQRRHHLAGALGDAYLARILALAWARRVKGSRIIEFSPRGEKAFFAMLR
jgi:hypothetical protein